MKKLHKPIKINASIKKSIKILTYFKFTWTLIILLSFNSSYAQLHFPVREINKEFEFSKTFIRDNDTILAEMSFWNIFIGIDNKIRISCSNKNTPFKVFTPFFKPIQAKGVANFTVNTREIKDGNIQIQLSDTLFSFNYHVSILPEPVIFFDKEFDDLLISNNFKNTTLKAECIGMKCKIKSFWMFITKNLGNEGTMILQPESNGANISDKQFQALKKLKNGDEFYLNGVLIEMPDSTTRVISSKKIKLIKSELYADIWRNMYHDIEGKFSIGKLYNNVRLKIDPNIPNPQKDTIIRFINEINQFLNGIQVKVVTSIPNYVIKQSPEQYYSQYTDYQNLFYPRTIGCDTHCVNFIGTEAASVELALNSIIDLIGGHTIEHKLEKDKYGNYHLTSRCKEFIQLLYSDNGINTIYNELNTENPRDFRKDYTLIIVIISFIIFLILRELAQSISFTRTFFIKKTSWWKQLLSCLLISQLPLIMIFMIQHSNEIKTTGANILSAEKYFLLFSILIGTMLWGLDKLQLAIKSFPLRLLLDFVLTMVIFWAAYQLLFMATHLDYVRVDMLRWQWIYIPLMVAIYRIYSLYNQRKIDQLLQEKELEISKQKELTTKAELLALQSRINPHFLYNALNSIASLTSIDAHKAEQMSVDLAKLFRYNLNKAEDLMTTIESELEMVKLYLDIEKQRFGDRLDYQVDVPNELMSFQIPIFLLQPLVENAIKHGVSKITEQGVLKIKIEKNDHQLFIRVFDNGPLFTDELIFGYGLQNIFDKLTLVYKDNYTIRFVNENEKNIEIGILEKREL